MDQVMTVSIAGNDIGNAGEMDLRLQNQSSLTPLICLTQFMCSFSRLIIPIAVVITIFVSASASAEGMVNQLASDVSAAIPPTVRYVVGGNGAGFSTPDEACQQANSGTPSPPWTFSLATVFVNLSPVTQYSCVLSTYYNGVFQYNQGVYVDTFAVCPATYWRNNIGGAWPFFNCVPPSTCPANSARDSNGSCFCNVDFKPDSTSTSCIPNHCPSHSSAPDSSPTCTCDSGFVANSTVTACVEGNGPPIDPPPPPNNNQDKNFSKDEGCTSCSCPANIPAVGNPINPATGLKYQVETDYRSSTGLELKRTYNSLSTDKSAVAGSLGSVWRLAWQRSIQGATTDIISQLRVPPLLGAILAPYGVTVPRGDQASQMYTAPAASTTIVVANVIRGSGSVFTFKLVGGVWQSDADVNGHLSTQLSTTGGIAGWTYTTEDQDVEQYNPIGQLLSVTNRTGQTTTLSYSDGTINLPYGGYVLDATGAPTVITLPAGLLLRVTDAYQHSLSFGYDAASRIVKMTDPAGGVYNYTYDTNSNLASVTYPDGKTKTYLYENPTYIHALTGILDENGNRYATYAYDTNGRAISTEHAGGAERVAIAYNSDGSASITDALGTVRTQLFKTVLGVVKNGGSNQPGGSGCGAATSGINYDVNGNPASRTDFNGNVTTYTYDLTRNLELSRTEASGTPQARTITTQWHPTYRLPAVVTEPLRTTTYTYDPQGNLLTQTIQPVPGIGGGTGVARTTTYTYNTAGQVLTIDGARTDVNDTTTYAYDPQGNLIKVSNALAQVNTLSGYDANGRVGTLTNPNGLLTTLTYDPRGRLVNRLVGTENTHYTYDGVGNLTNVALANGANYTYTYDQAHRLIQITDAQANRIVYTLDNAGNRTKEETFDNTNTSLQKHSRVFDALNRLYQDIGAVNQTTTYTYDANGNLTSVTDPLNRLSTNTYDALNRLSQVTNPDTGIIGYGYDAQDQLIRVTDPKSNSTRYSRDGLGNLNSTSSPDTGTSNATYDAAGNLLTKTDAKGQISTYTYDALNRLTHIGYSGGSAQAFDVTYLYDQGINGVTHLTGILDNTGVTQYNYDQQGRLMSEARQGMTPGNNGLIYTTGYNYDPLGRLTSTVYPSGRVVSYTYDVMGRINSISTNFNNITAAIASNITYRPFGGVQSYTYGDGQTTQVPPGQPNPTAQSYTRQYDQDGRIGSYTLNGQPLVIGYDAASQIININNPNNPINPATYNYDPMSRLNSYTQGAGNQSYNYDTVGNRVSQLIGSTSTSFGIDLLSNKLISVQSGAGVPQIVTQDAIGATTSDANHQYSYDIRGRLVQSTTAQGQINYEVNALGLRIRKQVPYANSDTQYHYDMQGHLIDENTTGTTLFSREYIWLGEIPVAVMQ